MVREEFANTEWVTQIGSGLSVYGNTAIYCAFMSHTLYDEPLAPMLIRKWKRRRNIAPGLPPHALNGCPSP